MFNYYRCTIEELTQHVLNSTCLTITKAKRYHAAKGHEDIVEMIAEARKRAAIVKMKQKVEAFEGGL